MTLARVPGESTGRAGSTPVSRETPPATPVEAEQVFNARLPLAVRYAELLAGPGVERGLIGPRETPRLWDRHLLNCVLLASIPSPGSTVADLGAGAGLPGLVLAIARPDVAVTLVEPLLRRSVFLDEAVADLGLTNVEVVRARAESLHGSRRFDVVTARALAPLDRLLGWAMPLVSRNGELVAMKGRSAVGEVAGSAEVLRRLRCRPPVVETLASEAGPSTATVVRVAHAGGGRVA